MRNFVSHPKEEHRIRLFENEVLKRIFATKQKKITEQKKNKEKLHNLYSSNTF
jgi:hypothetical protein